MTDNLYIVSTPIGNLDDLSMRALKVLREVDIILAESVERTKILLSHYHINKKIFSYNKDNEKRKINIVCEYLKSNDIALVTDAGTPSISDPGFFLLSNIPQTTKVIPIPGVSSLTCALSVSRIPINSFIFLGFLPKNEKDRRKKLMDAADSNLPLCLFESKHRLVDLLECISEVYGENTKVGLFREMTKVYETIVHDKVDELIRSFKTVTPRGEFVIIVETMQTASPEKPYAQIIKGLMEQNYSNKNIVDIIKLLSNDSKKEIYKNVLSIRQDT